MYMENKKEHEHEHQKKCKHFKQHKNNIKQHEHIKRKNNHWKTCENDNPSKTHENI